MTAVDHAELKRLDDEDCETCDGAGEVEAIIRASGGSDYIPCPDCVSRALNAEKAALLSEIEGLEAELEATKINEGIWFDIAHERRTQAPDSWRPDRGEIVAAIKYHTSICVGDYGLSATLEDVEDAADAILALRPQTAESGK